MAEADMGGDRRRWLVHVPDGYSVINPMLHPIEITVIDEPEETADE